VFRGATTHREVSLRLNPSPLLPLLAALVSLAGVACQSGGVGDPCIPEDEYRRTFSGYSASEVNVESRSFQCETRVCLVANFRGRVSCPYGQPAQTGPDADPTKAAQVPESERCKIPGTNELVDVPVKAQLVDRTPDQAVYCSCRCDGPDKNARYCECPSGYVCQKLIDDLGFGSGQLAGSYCIKDSSQVEDATRLDNGQECRRDVEPKCEAPEGIDPEGT
jgi:hypothetical protein